MSVQNGTYTFGPPQTTLTVRTGKAGAASKAGHNLRIEVGDWSATLTVGATSTLQLSADSRSFKVLEGTGGIQPLKDDDRASIKETIDTDVLKGATIGFQSTEVTPTATGLHVAGELDLFGKRRPVSFELSVDDAGHLTGEAVVSHAAYDVKPYSALFGTLKVADEVRVSVDGQLG